MRSVHEDWDRWLFCFLGRHQPKESRNIKKSGHMVQTKKQDKFPETDSNESEVCDLLDREFKIFFIRMLTKVRRFCCWYFLIFVVLSELLPYVFRVSLPPQNSIKSLLCLITLKHFLWRLSSLLPFG